MARDHARITVSIWADPEFRRLDRDAHRWLATGRSELAHKPGYSTRERAQIVLEAMPDPARMEIVEESD